MLRLVVPLCAFTLCLGLAEAIVANTLEGPVIGVSSLYFDEFKGIPYAQPPTDLLRFRPPRTLQKRTKTYDATSFKSVCTQAVSTSNFTVIGSEDCLYLNVMRPHSARPGAAVMLWIHGGNYKFGGGSYYNGEFLSKGSNTIIVTINYRLGAFGFLALNELLARDNTTGSYGHQDQRMAIQWVYNNIKFFGGDPTKITIAGESAGALSTCVHLSDPKSRPYFRGAIIESSYLDCQILPLSLAVYDSSCLTVALGCPVSGESLLNCVLNAHPAKLVETYNKLGYAFFRPCLDGTDLTQQPIDVIGTGTTVPLLIGTNANEYPSFHCTAQHVADLVAATNSVYFYEFNYGPAKHANELPFLWNHDSLASNRSSTILSYTFKDYWISFVEDRVPTSAAKIWPPYTAADRKYIILDHPLNVSANYNCQICAEEAECS